MFGERAKTIALAIVKIFETSKPFGDYSAVFVFTGKNNDGAGISYGVSQFTHKSGSLYAVLKRFLALGGNLPGVVDFAMPDFEVGINIIKRGNDKPLKQALAELGKDPLMQRAQREIAFENYLKPALEACEGSNFNYPLSLAVIYDSMNHGSWGKIRDRVKLNLPASIKPEEFEKEWISQYVSKRDAWLESVPRLAITDYRTDFFLAQIARGNWDLKLPLNVHGFKLTDEILFPKESAAAPQKPADRPDPVTEKAPAQTTAADLEDALEPGGEFTEGDRPAAPEPPPAVYADNVASMNVQQAAAPASKPLPQNEPVTVKKERSSVWAKIGAGVAILMGMGINVGNFVNNKLNEMTLPQLGYVLGGIAIIAAGLWLYDRGAQRAHEKTQSKMRFASDTEANTVELEG